MTKTRGQVEQEIAALESQRLELVRAEEAEQKRLKAEKHARERKHLTDLLKDYQAAEANRQECLRALFLAVRDWSREHPVRVRFAGAGAHMWQGQPLALDLGESERLLVAPLNAAVDLFEV